MSCMLPVCGFWRYVWHGGILRVQFTATLACFGLAFTLGGRLVVNKPPSVDEVNPKVAIVAKDSFVPHYCPKDESTTFEYDKNSIKELDTKTTCVLCNICATKKPR